MQARKKPETKLWLLLNHLNNLAWTDRIKNLFYTYPKHKLNYEQHFNTMFLFKNGILRS